MTKNFAELFRARRAGRRLVDDEILQPPKQAQMLGDARFGEDNPKSEKGCSDPNALDVKAHEPRLMVRAIAAMANMSRFSISQGGAEEDAPHL